jgi:hypothetical protein
MQRTPSGWAVFAATVLAIVGAINVLYGLAGIINDDVLISTSSGGLLISDYTLWGWVTLAIGVVMLFTSYGLWTVNPFAQGVAVVIAMISAISMIHLITAFPLWAILIIVLDVLVIYNLTVKGGEAAPVR